MSKVAARTDPDPLSREAWGVVIVCALIAMIDGFDTQAIGVVAPELARTWHVAPASFGPVFGLGLFGGLVGAMVFGPAGDRFGRKPCLIIAVALFGLLSLTTPLVTTLAQLRGLRLATGFGLGAALPCVIAIASEVAPPARRAAIVSWMFCGFPLGALAGGIAAAMIVPEFGWKPIFVVGGLVPFLFIPFVIRFVPETARSPSARSADALLPLPSLFRNGRATGTLLIWATLFLSLVMSYFLLNWLPLVARTTGIGLRGAALAVAALNFGTIAGCLVLGPLASRWPSQVVATAYVAGGGAIALIGQAGQSAPLLLVASFAAGFFATGAQFCTIALGAAFYETWLRATGIGWSIGIARVGGVLGPLLGGWLVGAAVGVPHLFELTAGVSLAAAVAAFALGRVVVRIHPVG